MAGWHQWLDGRESEWTPGVGDGQGGLVCCDSWGRKKSDMTERLIWLIWSGHNCLLTPMELVTGYWMLLQMQKNPTSPRLYLINHSTKQSEKNLWHMIRSILRKNIIKRKLNFLIWRRAKHGGKGSPSHSFPEAAEATWRRRTLSTRCLHSTLAASLSSWILQVGHPIQEFL